MILATIIAILIMNKMPKTIGETISTTLVSETSKIVVNTRPVRNINRITPKVIMTPNKKMVLRLGSLSET